jgi:hypothetical protein
MPGSLRRDRDRPDNCVVNRNFIGGEIMLHRGELTLEEIRNSLLQVDHLLPIQFFDTFRRKTLLEPERILMLAILEDAISCVQKYKTPSSGKDKRLFDQALEWILTEDDEWLFSFNSVCEAVGVSPGCLRPGLIRIAEGKSGKAGKSKSGKSSQPIKKRTKARIDRAAA